MHVLPGFLCGFLVQGVLHVWTYPHVFWLPLRRICIPSILLHSDTFVHLRRLEDRGSLPHGLMYVKTSLP